jgi:hypothetical protein
MRNTRKNLYDFLKTTTDLTKGNNFNDGTILNNFGEGNKKGVEAFGFDKGCSSDASEALKKIFDYNDFQYKENTKILLIKKETQKETQEEIQTVIESKLTNEKDTDYTSNPPFYDYLLEEKNFPKNITTCNDKENLKILIGSFVLRFPEDYTNNKKEEDKNNKKEEDKNNKKAEDKNNKKEEDKNNKKAEDKKGLSLIEFQFYQIYENIPDLDTRNAIIGKDYIKDLVNKESEIKIMSKTMSEYAKNLKEDKESLIQNNSLNTETKIKMEKMEKKLEDKMNKIYKLFEHLFQSSLKVI